MNKRIMNYAAIGAYALGLFGLNSCLKVDDTYDLDKDIDMTITVGGDLILPGSSTEKMLLGDLLELEDDGIIKANEATGDYALVQKGESTSTNINVDKVEIENLIFTGFDKNQNIGSATNISEITVPIENQSIEINIKEENITDEILNVEKAFTLATNGKFTIKLSNNIQGRIKEGYTITFPEYMTVTSIEEFCTVENGNVLKIIQDVDFTSQQDININITAITFGKPGAEFSYENHAIELSGNIVVNGNITLPGQQITSGVTPISMNTNVSCEKLSLNSVCGTVKPKENKNSIEIGELPDFLNGDDVTIDVTDPRIYLTVSNSTDADITLNATLTPTINGENGDIVNIDGLTVPANQTNYKICIHQNRNFQVDGHEVIVENLNSLIEKIPDVIDFEIQQIEASEGGITLGSQIEIQTDYELNTPLMFGSKTNIKYEEVIDGWTTDLEDAEFETVEVLMTVINEIPLGLNMQAIAIDKNGNKLDNVNIESNIDIEAGTTENAKTKEAKLAITALDGSIKGLDGIKLIITATASESTAGTALNANQTLKFDDIKLRLKGGITMDLN